MDGKLLTEYFFHAGGLFSKRADHTDCAFVSVLNYRFKVILDGIKGYVEDVTTCDFPQRENWFTMKDDAYEDLCKMLDPSRGDAEIAD